MWRIAAAPSNRGECCGTVTRVKTGDRGPAGLAVVAIAGPALGRRIAAALEDGDVRVMGIARDAEQAASFFEESPPDAVVIVRELDDWPPASINLVREHFPETRIIVIASFPTSSQVREALARGVDGLVLEDDLELSLSPSVTAACAGQLVLPAKLRPSLVKPALSTREKQALAMVVMGFTNQEIARKLHLTESTVKTHLYSSFKKLGVRSRAQATQVILDPEHGLGTGILAISADVEPLG